MTKFFSYPIKPHWVSQTWGNYRPELYNQFGFKRHNGLDHIFGSHKRIYAPCDGTIIINDNQPTGGGIYVSLLSNPIAFPSFFCSTPDGKSIPFQAGVYRVRIDFLHLEKSLQETGNSVKEGDLIAIGDNTGFSTGAHCHTQWRRVLNDGSLTHADDNEANNSFDPAQFFSGIYAEDLQELKQKMKALILILKSYVGLLSANKR